MFSHLAKSSIAVLTLALAACNESPTESVGAETVPSNRVAVTGIQPSPQTATSATTTQSFNDEAKTKVQTFYDFLSNPGSEVHAQAFRAASAETWESIGNYSGKNKSRDAFTGQLGGFAKLMPDLQWEVQSMHQEGSQVVVRSRATGTPQGPLFGVDGQGRSFDIMTIDIHELENGLIARSYHVEDWAGALQQLKGPNASGQAAKQTAMAFMEAMGKGEMEKMAELMADDMVWQNGGDRAMPWIGPWNGKDAIFGFLKSFSENVETTKWENQDVLAAGDTVAMFGRMKLKATKSGHETDEFTFGLRIKVRDGKIVLWNWLEDSFAVSNAYHGK